MAAANPDEVRNGNANNTEAQHQRIPNGNQRAQVKLLPKWRLKISELLSSTCVSGSRLKKHRNFSLSGSQRSVYMIILGFA